MSNLAYKQERSFHTTQQTEVTVKTVKRQSRITPGEKVLSLLLIAFVAIMAIKIISAQAQIYEVNKEIEDIKTAVQEQQKINGDLEMQVSEQSRYERIWKRGQELGLNLDENNVRVVEKK